VRKAENTNLMQRSETIRPLRLWPLAAMVLWITTALAGGREPIAPLEAPRAAPRELIELGRDLFHDVRLSKNDSVSCAHCHPLARAGVDGLRVSVGVEGRRGLINAPTVYNTADQIAQFWDGSADSLEALVLEGPLQDPLEMDSNWPDALAKLGSDPVLRARFEQLFDDGLTKENVARAIAVFVAGLVTLDSPFDRWLKGDEAALDARQKEGYALFKSYGCIACHQGRNVGGNMYATMGVMGDYFADRGGELTRADLGRFNVTGRDSDRFVFKVPSLRLVVRTAPYFHDGSAATLEEAVTVMARYQLGRELPEAHLQAIVAFLKSLAGSHPELDPAP